MIALSSQHPITNPTHVECKRETTTGFIVEWKGRQDSLWNGEQDAYGTNARIVILLVIVKSNTTFLFRTIVQFSINSVFLVLLPNSTCSVLGTCSLAQLNTNRSRFQQDCLSYISFSSWSRTYTQEVPPGPFVRIPIQY